MVIESVSTHMLDAITRKQNQYDGIKEIKKIYFMGLWNTSKNLG
jgi:hypothetical protein